MPFTTAKTRIQKPRVDSVSRYVRRNPEKIAPDGVGISPEIETHSHDARFVVHPLCGIEPIDVTQKVIEAIAHELWKSRGGNDLLNWLEAERLFNQTMRNGSVESSAVSPSTARRSALRHQILRGRLHSQGYVVDNEGNTASSLAHSQRS